MSVDSCDRHRRDFATVARPSSLSNTANVLAVIDWLFTVVHVLVVLGFVLLWISPRTARLHRWLVVATAASWLVLGWWKGLGYCFLTDWHWQVKRSRGEEDLPGSFLKYAGDAVTGRDLAPSTVDAIAAATFVGGCFAALWRYRQDRLGPTSKRSNNPIDESS